MQLVQLSDIHVGSFFKQQVFDNVVDEVNKLKPDAVIITGDLTDEGLLFQFEYVHAQIKKFTCSNIIVLAGNHDYRHTGYIKLVTMEQLIIKSKYIIARNSENMINTIS
jgi:Icc protein